MKHVLTFGAVALLLSGCVTPDSFVSSEAAEARQELRAQQYQHLGCADLRRLLVANEPEASGALAILAPQNYGLASQTRADLLRAMNSKGCRLPAGYE